VRGRGLAIYVTVLFGAMTVGSVAWGEIAATGGLPMAHFLAALGALRSGAGLVTVATPRSCLPIVAAMAPEYMTEGLEETASGTVDYGALDRVLDFQADIIAVGPGLGQAPGTAAFVHGLLERAGIPLIMDADALNAFREDPDRLLGRDGVDVVITPHPGEMARLLNLSVEAVQHDRLRHATDFASRHRVHVVLKGHRTVIATPENRAFINLTGNSGMATGGTGDLLTGMIAAWFGQLLDAEAACKLAVYLHGTAGDLAEADEGEASEPLAPFDALEQKAWLERREFHEGRNRRVEVSGDVEKRLQRP
jgi:NAD(P)H-hydrate epimerase